MDLTTLGIVMVGGVFLVGLLLILVGFRSMRSRESTNRLEEFVLYQERPKASAPERAQAQQQSFSETFLERTFVAGFKKLLAFLGRLTPKYSLEKTNHQLAIIRNPGNIRAREFFGIRLISLVLGVALAFVLNLRNLDDVGRLLGGERGVLASWMAHYQSTPMLLVYGGIAIVLVFFLLPVAWLSGQVRKTKEEIQRTLPDALDMLSVCADAGLGFDQALQRVGEYMQNAIGAEFRRVVSEMEVGISRGDAMRNMSDRLEVSELSSFVSIIIQSEALGMRIADVLHGQADQMRIIRQFKAKEIAYRLPAKMIIPLATLILPALLIVILGPLLPKIFGLLSIG